MGGPITRKERKNCWEHKNCGFGPDKNGRNDKPQCPAASPGMFNGVNKGAYAGRFCWAVAETFCGGASQGRFANKFVDCLQCDFFRQVDLEEGRFLVLTPFDIKNTTSTQEEIETSNSGFYL